MSEVRPLAVVTGASSGIGLELARLCAKDGYDLIIAANEQDIDAAADELRREGGDVLALNVDLSTHDGVAKLYRALQRKPVAILCANAGRGLGKGFLDQAWEEAKFVVDTNVNGTLELIHLIGGDMRQRQEGRILITGSIAGFMPGAYQAVYNGTKAFLDSFSYALREELKQTPVTVTCLMPGPTETEFFERGDLMDTKVGQQEKDDPAGVAKDGYDAMKAGKGGVVSGLKNKMQAAAAHVMPAERLAKMHADMAKPGTGQP